MKHFILHARQARRLVGLTLRGQPHKSVQALDPRTVVSTFIYTCSRLWRTAGVPQGWDPAANQFSLARRIIWRDLLVPSCAEDTFRDAAFFPYLTTTASSCLLPSCDTFFPTYVFLSGDPTPAPRVLRLSSVRTQCCRHPPTSRLLPPPASSSFTSSHHYPRSRHRHAHHRPPSRLRRPLPLPACFVPCFSARILVVQTTIFGQFPKKSTFCPILHPPPASGIR